MVQEGDASKGANSGGLQIDLDAFSRRLEKFYDSWKSSASNLSSPWGGSDAIAIAVPPVSEDLRYLKSSSLQIWLLSYEFPDTIMLFFKNSVHIFTSQKKASHLEAVRDACAGIAGLKMVLRPRKKDVELSVQLQGLVDSIKEEAGGNPKLGVLTKEAADGNLLETWAKVLKDSGYETSDVSQALAELFAVKDDAEVINVRKAAFLSAQVLKNYVVPKLEEVIDEEKKITHAELMDITSEICQEPLKAKIKLKAENCDICYPPVFQSGGQYDLRPGAESTDDPLFYEAMSVIVCSVGARYASYCSNIGRTYLIDPSPSQAQAYKALLKCQEAAIANLKPGKKLNEVYKAALSVLEKEPEGSLYAQKFLKNAGSGIGIEYREASLALNAKNEREVRDGMVFNVAVGLHGLENASSSDEKSREYSVLLADTVLVKAGKAEVLTSSCSKTYQDAAYSFKDDEEEEEKESERRSKPMVKSDISQLPVGVQLRSENQEATKEELRRQHQVELAKQKSEETARRLAAKGGASADDPSGLKRSAGDFMAFKDVDEISGMAHKELAIQVDQRHEAVLLPIYGLLVPFHVSTIKTVSSQQDGGSMYIRVIFSVPGSGLSANDPLVQKFPNSIYLKELSFRSSDIRHANQIVQLIKTLSRQVRQRESERAERATLVVQEKLQFSKSRPVRLPDLWIRPAFGGRGRKLTGSLEAHANGFRYSTSRQDERVDIMFRNIKHAFFQPAEKELITLLHFHLHNPIMLGNKKTKDVQFYAEVMEVVQTVGNSRRAGYDPDEIEEEQRERERKNKINREFEAFVKRVQDQWEKDFKDLDLEFDVPFRDLGFPGVPHKSTTFVVPTVNCLVELIETPFLVVTLSEIEIVNLERVGMGQKTFDMAIVFKDFKREVLRIDAIPSTCLEGVKEWLNSMNLKYYESRLNLSWKAILQSITADPESFLANGGWDFLDLQAADSDEEDSEDSEAYEPSGGEEEEQASDSEEEDGDDDNESVVDSEDDEEGGEGEEEDEEEGLSWDELEEKARREDKEKGAESDSEDERRRRRKAGRGGGGGSVLSSSGGFLSSAKKPIGMNKGGGSSMMGSRNGTLLGKGGGVGGRPGGMGVGPSSSGGGQKRPGGPPPPMNKRGRF